MSDAHEAIGKAIDLLRNYRPEPCFHLVHPSEINAEVARCASCFQVFSPRALREQARGSEHIQHGRGENP